MTLLSRVQLITTRTNTIAQKKRAKKQHINAYVSELDGINSHDHDSMQRRQITALLLCASATSVFPGKARATIVDEDRSELAYSIANMSVVGLRDVESGVLVSSGFVWSSSSSSSSSSSNTFMVATTASDVIGVGKKSLRCSFSDGREYECKIAFSDLDTNVAFLKVSMDDDDSVLMLPKAMKIGRSGSLRVGQDAFASFVEKNDEGKSKEDNNGLAVLMRAGIVSGLNRTVPSVNGKPLRNCIQTTASFPFEASGGVLLDSSSNVVGVLAPTYSQGKSGGQSAQGSSMGIYFAIPIDEFVLISQKITTMKV